MQRLFEENKGNTSGRNWACGRKSNGQILNRDFVEQVLEQLPDESREVLTLYYFQELKLTEISDTLQIGLPLVKYRLQKARKQLRELLGKEEFDESERKDKKI